MNSRPARVSQAITIPLTRPQQAIRRIQTHGVCMIFQTGMMDLSTVCVITLHRSFYPNSYQANYTRISYWLFLRSIERYKFRGHRLRRQINPNHTFKGKEVNKKRENIPNETAPRPLIKRRIASKGPGPKASRVKRCPSNTKRRGPALQLRLGKIRAWPQIE